MTENEPVAESPQAETTNAEKPNMIWAYIMGGVVVFVLAMALATNLLAAAYPSAAISQPPAATETGYLPDAAPALVLLA
jgi:flagellar basal body-associated protein FliL